MPLRKKREFVFGIFLIRKATPTVWKQNFPLHLSYWSFPKVEGIHMVDSKFIFYLPTAQVVTSKRGFQFGQHHQDALKIYKLIKNNN